ncbi:MAG TPA: cytochrome c [Pyrinomonadaceae bacterium]|nr:cytochrome c [Pyrinomonadaceae bacterium]
MHSRSETVRVSSRLAKTLTLALACLALASAGCSTHGDARAQSADPARELFERNCAACHGQQGEGKQIGTLKAPSLCEGRAATDTDERLLKQIHDGGNGMPPFKYSLTDEQIDDLLRFVRGDLQASAASKQ